VALKLEMKNLPSPAKVVIAIFPATLAAVLLVVFLIMPKQKEIAALDVKIDEQNNKIAVSQAKGAKLNILIQENERLLKRLAELKQQLPDEKEISSLLKQVSDLSIGAGLEMKSWKPGQKRTHPGGIVYEIPVSVIVTGTYHNFGRFLASLTRLDRIVNITNIQMGNLGGRKGGTMLQISFTASTFSAIPEAEMKKEAVKK